jgi:hypothetical protein
MADQNDSVDSTLDSLDEDEVPEMRKKPDDPVDSLISSLKISKSIRVSFIQSNLIKVYHDFCCNDSMKPW